MPGASAGTPSSASSAPLLGFGDAFKRPSGSWDCDVCLVRNKAADVACVACQTAKPGAKVEPKGKNQAFYLSNSKSVKTNITLKNVEFLERNHW